MAVGTTTTEVLMPHMGESVSEGTVLEWHKQVGDTVAVEETLVEVSTDKVDAEVPATVSGTLAKILVVEGETVEVGAPLCEIALEDEAGDNGSATNGAGASIDGAPGSESGDAHGDAASAMESSPTPTVNGASTTVEPDQPTGALIDLVMPQMGESVSGGTVLEWHKQAGDSVEVDETVVEISTDKVDAEVPAPASGTLAEVLAEAGETVEVGQVLARISAGAQAAPATDTPPAPDDHARPPAPAASGNGAAAPPAAADANDATPVARRAAAAHGVELDRVPGSGPRGRVQKEDVLAHVSNGGASVARPPTPGAPVPAPAAAPSSPPAAVEAAGAQPIRGAGAVLARYMDESRQIPTATSFRVITVTALDGRRRQLKGTGKRVSFTHLIGFAVARAATEIPVMAHHFRELDGKPHRVDDGQVNLGLAVDVEKKDGSRTLMVPVIRDAGRLAFAGYLAAYDSLVDKARTNSLAADELTGANVSLTNPGGLGTVASVPRLMIGQGTIVATGSIGYPPGLAAIGAQIGAEKVMTMTSTYDHRIIQGAQSGRFLARVEGLLRGEDGFYEDVFASLGVAVGPEPAPPCATITREPAPGTRVPPGAGSPVPPAPAAGAPAAGVAPGAVASPAPGIAAPPTAPDEEMLGAVQAAMSLLKAHRMHGHLAARLDPLGSAPEGDPALDPEPLGLTEELMERIPARILRTGVAGESLADALPHLRETYCGTLAYEIEHISSHRQRTWLRAKIESGAFRTPLSPQDQRSLLRRLIDVDALERFLHKAYLGQKQFSIEGVDMTVPMLDEMIELAAGVGAREVVIGMAHRGRLNVLAHNLGRPPETIFAEFEGASTLEAVTTIPQGGTGDVKYHHGAEGSYELAEDHSILVRLESNPSHLEFVHPVVEGATRAAQTSRQGPHAHIDPNTAFPIVIHGDAAFPGQGVVAETLNLQSLEGYLTGGTLHLITNNQVGFTTDPGEARSTRWASDLAKGFDVPIIHVNADDVAACIYAVRLAFAFRQEFGHDVLIDLIGYRRFGHNEADEPAYTQPEMATTIQTHPRVRELYAARLIEQGVVTQEEVDAQLEEAWSRLADLHSDLKELLAAASHEDQPTGEYQLDRTPSPDVTTAVSAERLHMLNDELLRVPEGFTVHPKLLRQLERRREALGADGGIDWAHAETLAFASLLTEGTPVRLTGQDTERGTFSQRHLVFHDARNGRRISPIQSLPGALATMELHNSPLSEIACLGFEYGYSQEAPETLVLWEAQFGDFANTAQVIIDQFIVSGLAKWGLSSRLTLLLPHGYEGSGPEHSSARLERFLQLAAEGNLRVANLTTPAQYFHMIRRQARVAKQRPLVLMTPKSLLRLPQSTNRIEHLSQSQFLPVLHEPRVIEDNVARLLLCTGKVYYDLVGHPARQDNERVAVGRVELLYPFPERQILELMRRYPGLREVVWVQEEPRNMGARAHMSPRLMQIMPDELDFGYIGRPERSSPGEGYPVAHVAEQDRILRTALNADDPVSQYPRKTPGER